LPLAGITFAELTVSVVEIVLFVIWAGLLLIIFADLFWDHDMSGRGRALWIVFLVLIPYASMLVYVIVRSTGMRERGLRTQSEARYQRDLYRQPPRPAAGPAHELHKLADLKEKGALSTEEFDRAKAKMLA
jgi:hypothetical protein